MLRQFRAGLSKATVPGSAPQPLRSIRYPLNISLGRFSGWQKFRNLSHDRSPRTGRSCFASTSTSGSSSASSSPASAPGQQQPQKSAQDKGSGFIERPSQNLHLLPEELLQKPAFKHAIWISKLFQGGRILSWLDLALRLVGFSIQNAHQHRLSRQLASSLKAQGFKDFQIIARLRDGGAFVVFPTAQEAAEGQQAVLDGLAGVPKSVGCHLVLGQLFLEDILNVSQTARLQIVVPSTVTKQMMPSEQQAHLFRLLRPFGRLISVDGGKDGVWEVDFLLSSSAVAARNCLQNMDFLSFVNGLEARDMESSAEKGPRALQLQFVSFSRFEDLKEWLKSPKFATAFFLFLGALLVILVQPFRLANVVQTLALPWKHEESVRELLSKENSALGWIDRGDVRAVLEGAFNRRPNPVLLLSGPKGVGKTTLIKDIVNKRRHAVRISCEGMGQSATPSDFVSALESAIGFTPSFHFLNTVLSYVQMIGAGKSNIGQSSNETLDQLNRILSTLEMALRLLNTRLTPNNNSNNHHNHSESRIPGSAEASNGTAFMWRKTHPVIVIDQAQALVLAIEDKSLSDDRRKEATMLLDRLLDWSVLVSRRGLAHIVLVVDHSWAAHELKSHSALVSGALSCIPMGDCSYEDAEQYVSAALSRHRGAQLRLLPDSGPKKGVKFTMVSTPDDGIFEEGEEDTDREPKEDGERKQQGDNHHRKETSLSIWDVMRFWRRQGGPRQGGHHHRRKHHPEEEEEEGREDSPHPSSRQDGIRPFEGEPSEEESWRMDAQRILAVIGGRVAHLETALLHFQHGHSVTSVLETMVKEKFQFVLRLLDGSDVKASKLAAFFTRSPTSDEVVEGTLRKIHNPEEAMMIVSPVSEFDLVARPVSQVLVGVCDNDKDMLRRLLNSGVLQIVDSQQLTGSLSATLEEASAWVLNPEDTSHVTAGSPLMATVLHEIISNKHFQRQVRNRLKDEKIEQYKREISDLQSEILELLERSNRFSLFGWISGQIPEEGLELRRRELDNELAEKLKELWALQGKEPPKDTFAAFD